MEETLTKQQVPKETRQRTTRGGMSFKFCCPYCGMNYITYNDNYGKYAKCRTCQYLFSVTAKANITAYYKTAFIERVLIQGSDLLYNEIDKLILKLSIKIKQQNVHDEGLVNYDPYELLYFTDYIVCELLKMERLNKKTYREIIHNFLKIHLREFKTVQEMKYRDTISLSRREGANVTRQRARMGEYLRYLSNIGTSWETIIMYDKDNHMIFNAIERVSERLSFHLFKGRVVQEFVYEAVETVQLFFSTQVDQQRKFQKFILEEVIKIKRDK
jgi:hypothetical protein